MQIINKKKNLKKKKKISTWFYTWILNFFTDGKYVEELGKIILDQNFSFTSGSQVLNTGEKKKQMRSNLCK